MDDAPASFLVRHQFLIRRLHSLSGLIPVGAYMCVHLVTNASVLAGAQTFQDQVDTIHRLGPVLPLVEWTFIFLPIIFHAAVGVIIVRGGLPNTGSYPYQGNVRYTLQRATAWIALFFIFWHVFHMHGWIHDDYWIHSVAEPLGGAQFDPEYATSTAALALRPLVVKILYAVGVTASVFHFANGLWTMGITWGVWISPAAQRRAGYVCSAFGVGILVVGFAALAGMSTADVNEARAVETVRIEQREEQERRQRELQDQLERGADESSSSTAERALPPPR